MTAPIVVYKDSAAKVWRWDCRRPYCGRTEWRETHGRALNNGIGHLREHARTGFGR